jgi:hypothetical protein
MTTNEQLVATCVKPTFDTDLPDAVRHILGDGDFPPEVQKAALLGFVICYRNSMGFTAEDFHEQ